MKYFGWRRAELAHLLKWVPAVEQLELFSIGEVDSGVDRRSFVGYLDDEVSVSALEAEARVGSNNH